MIKIIFLFILVIYLKIKTKKFISIFKKHKKIIIFYIIEVTFGNGG